jgi:hypothetical protein
MAITKIFIKPNADGTITREQAKAFYEAIMGKKRVEPGTESEGTEDEGTAPTEKDANSDQPRDEHGEVAPKRKGGNDSAAAAPSAGGKA